MKTQVYIAALMVGITIFSSGCVRSSMAELAKGLGENHSTVKSKLATVYGTHDFTRANPAPGQSVTIHPDGTITIVSQANTNTNVAK